MTCAALFGNDGGEGFHLVLGATEGAYATLDELSGTLVLFIATRDGGWQKGREENVSKMCFLCDG